MVHGQHFPESEVGDWSNNPWTLMNLSMASLFSGKIHVEYFLIGLVAIVFYDLILPLFHPELLLVLVEVSRDREGS